MSVSDWNELWSHFHRIVTLDRDRRKAALDALPDDQAREVEELLSAHDQPDSLLDQAVELADVDQSGRRIGPWRLQSLLGEGGMGQVWLAERADGAYQQDVAIKFLALGLPTRDLVQRFAREREILARLDHPHIARLIDGGTLPNGQPYLVMERVEGQALGRYCDKHAPTFRQRVGLMRQVCAAVDHAHRRLIVHRDLKPDNILVTANAEPKLLDFGIAHLLSPDSNNGQTLALDRRLTLEYASPEQLRGDPVDLRSDVFSLGVILFELLAGQRPWDVSGQTAHQAHDRLTDTSPLRLSRALANRVEQPRARAGRAHSDLDWIVARAIAIDPEQRYPGARELGDDLQRYLEGFPIQARPPSAAYRFGRFMRRHPWGVSTAAAVTLMVLASATALWQQSRALSQALQEARQQTVRAGSLSDFLAALLVEADPEVHQGDPRTVEQVLIEATDRIETEFQNEAGLKSELLTTLANIFFSRGDYAQARRLTAAALSLDRGSENAQAQLLEARLSLVDGRYDDALQQAGGLSGSAAPGIAHAARLLRVEAHQSKDDLAAAERELSEIDLSSQHGDAAIEAWFRQGGLHWGRGDFGAAESSYRSALAIQTELHGQESLQASRGLNAIASVRYRQGDLAAAEDLFRQVLARHEQILGANHARSAETRVRLGALLYDRQNLAAARSQLERALVDQIAAFGPDHINLANTHNNLGLVLAAQQAFSEAEAEFRAALAINEATHGPLHSRVAGNLSNLGWMKIEQNQPEQARPVLMEALARQRQIFEGGHPQLAYTLHHLGRLALLETQLPAAEDWLNQALRMRQTLLDSNHPSIADTHLILAELSERVGATHAAIDHLEAVLRIRDERNLLSDESRTALQDRLTGLRTRLAGLSRS